MGKIAEIQTILGVTADGQWGPKSQAALDSIKTSPQFHGKASSFADPADIRAFERCKQRGGTDEQCFAVGDNGEGYWGDNTKEGSGACCAIPKHYVRERWGSLAAGKHKLVDVSIEGKIERLIVKDVQSDHLGSGAIIDLNPDAAKLFGLTPPFLVPCVWSWV